jgi:hypothetical protein
MTRGFHPIHNPKDVHRIAHSVQPWLHSLLDGFNLQSQIGDKHAILTKDQFTQLFFYTTNFQKTS